MSSNSWPALVKCFWREYKRNREEIAILIVMNTSSKLGSPHSLPKDVRQALTAAPLAAAAWKTLTPLARNEWICWIISVKQKETRMSHIVRLIAELQEGKRRPCCWIGCIHRSDKQLSPSVTGILADR